jgi:hypothetical protein
MNINRHNYEEFFILYLDNELSAEELREVEAFAQQNPDLKAELDMLQQSKLTPDTGINFMDKGSLMRFENSSINLTNYEEWLIAYVDNELNEEDRKQVEHFIASNPAIQKELDLLQQVKLQPEAIIFPNKESLYRKEEKAPRIILMSWRRIVVAAILLFAISITAIVVLNKKGDDKIELASGKQPAVKEKSTDNNLVKQDNNNTNNEQVTNQQQIAVAVDKKDEPVVKQQAAIADNKTRIPVVKETKILQSPVEITRQEEVIAKDKIEQRPTNNLPKPESNPIVKSYAEQGNVATGNDSNNSSLTNATQNSNKPNVTSTDPETSSNTEESNGQNNSDVITASNTSNSNKGGGLRGFFRKVTRTFEKKANIKTDEDDRLLIAGVAIKLN